MQGLSQENLSFISVIAVLNQGCNLLDLVLRVQRESPFRVKHTASKNQGEQEPGNRVLFLLLEELWDRN